ncbi:hypothetical protein [Empedobacter brevis]|uniref:hypothetical protein n=1 Tax=Empedobacter brevis TaxID=247 RepID=UPI0028D37C6F|nr:hypothetical protein [Empedobacter brevis]
MNEIIEISQIECEKIIEKREPLGLFIVHTTKRPIEVLEDSGFKTFLEDEDLFIAVDNSNGDAFTEEFDAYKLAIKWLTGNK